MSIISKPSKRLLPKWYLNDNVVYSFVLVFFFHSCLSFNVSFVAVIVVAVVVVVVVVAVVTLAAVAAPITTLCCFIGGVLFVILRLFGQCALFLFRFYFVLVGLV